MAKLKTTLNKLKAKTEKTGKAQDTRLKDGLYLQAFSDGSFLAWKAEGKPSDDELKSVLDGLGDEAMNIEWQGDTAKLSPSVLQEAK
jgi:hypothetical protein